jgi:cardiolipin synthase
VELTQIGMGKIAAAIGDGSFAQYKLRVYFDAQINANAQAGENIPNRATLHYTNSVNFDFDVESDEPVVYTGGTNLADEYANLYAKHGHWKDVAIRLEGEAVRSLTVQFLELWDGELGLATDYTPYLSPAVPVSCAQGFVQPFADGPVNNPDNPAESVYRSVISSARDYVYITTPYLIIDHAMRDVLIDAVESGVDVRIITPKIWDHWYVHAVTRSNYRELLEAGVRIYEYTPGYIHAKTIVSDDHFAVTGTINMDYRSFNLQFENGVWLCGAPVVSEIRADIEQTFSVSEEILLENHCKRPLTDRVLGTVLRLFAVFF